MTNPAPCPTVCLNSRSGDGDRWHGLAEGFLPKLPGLTSDVVCETTPAGLESV
jgi:hypothetical protein